MSRGTQPQWSPSEVARLERERDRASYVCWLLALDPFRVYPCGPETGTEADEHLIEWTCIYVDGLLDNVRRKGAQAVRTPDVVRYLLTLQHVDAVLSGQEDPATNGWFQNTLSFRRGVMLPLADNSKKATVPR